ncbi:hypothetical protein [Aquipuribacter hungaricus]|uniref:Cell shape protein MreC n=1 Tax=Aquipuribacter hungaricus TaxID=545624 RepID=A0ABV7WFF0_9MICO
MRWDALFADLEAQLEGEQRAALDAEVAERVRIERQQVTLVDRLRAHVGTALVLDTGRLSVRGTVREVGADFVLLDDEGGGYAVVPVAALEGVVGLGRAVAPPPGAVLRRLRLTAALRGLVRDRAEVQVLTAGTELRGVPAAVGADHLDLVLLSAGERDASAGPRTVPLAALRLVRSR